MGWQHQPPPLPQVELLNHVGQSDAQSWLTYSCFLDFLPLLGSWSCGSLGVVPKRGSLLFFFEPHGLVCTLAI